MNVEAIERAQAELEPRENLGQYAGLWVALRGGSYVASDTDAILLTAQPLVRDGDEILRIPTKIPDAGIYVF